MKERIPDPYVGLLKGEFRRLSDINQQVPYVTPALEIMLADGQVVGQYTPDGDVVLWHINGVKEKQEAREKAEEGHRKKEMKQGVKYSLQKRLF